MNDLRQQTLDWLHRAIQEQNEGNLVAIGELCPLPDCYQPIAPAHVQGRVSHVTKRLPFQHYATESYDVQFEKNARSHGLDPAVLDTMVRSRGAISEREAQLAKPY